MLLSVTKSFTRRFYYFAANVPVTVPVTVTPTVSFPFLATATVILLPLLLLPLSLGYDHKICHRHTVSVNIWSVAVRPSRTVRQSYRPSVTSVRQSVTPLSVTPPVRRRPSVTVTLIISSVAVRPSVALPIRHTVHPSHLPSVALSVSHAARLSSFVRHCDP